MLYSYRYRSTTFNLLFIFLIFFASCDKDKTKDVIIIVASKQPHIPVNVDNPSQYIVKYDGDQEWSLFYDLITGFDYQEGYEYIINVKVTTISNPPMDAGTKSYRLNYIISSEKKESEGIPSSWFTEKSIY